MTNMEKMQAYATDWNHAVKLHKQQIGIIGRIRELIVGSEFWFDLDNELYGKYGLSPYEVDRYYKLKF